MESSTSRIRNSESLWQPTVVLPSQLATTPSGRRSPEAWLMSAVLEDAFRCVDSNVGRRSQRNRRELREAYDWFSSDRRDWPFAFLTVCEVLGLDVAAVRQRVEHLVRADHAAAERFAALAAADARTPAPPSLPESFTTQSVDCHNGTRQTNSVGAQRDSGGWSDPG